jgi:flagellar basal-body rod modification protein FlgD
MANASSLPTALTAPGVQESASTAAKKKAFSLGDNSSEIQERFIKLLIAQLKNQDPLSPMDNAQITSQMAQLSTVAGVSTLNETVKGLSEANKNAQFLGASNLLGRSVLVDTNQVVYNGSAVAMAYQSPAQIDRAVMNIRDVSGQVVYSEPVGSVSAGADRQFVWNGTRSDGSVAQPGLYTVEVTGVDAEAKALAAKTQVAVPVVGLVNDGGSPKVKTALGTTVGFSEIKNLF